MTAEQKTAAARFLDLGLISLRSGYREREETYQFEDDAPAAAVTAPADSGVLGTIADVDAEVRRCTACALARTRKNAVPGEGAAVPLVMVVGEGPGADEDATGRPFVGKAGQLLDKMLAAIGLSRQKNCFIANTVKCRPPGNRDPEPEESAACARFLAAQIALLRPRFILCVGKVAANRLLHGPAGEKEPIGRLRGEFREYSGESAAGDRFTIPLLASYHPSALLRDESMKKPAFDDLKLLMARLAAEEPGYRGEVRPLMAKYAAADEAFAARVKEFL